jgi:uncharacterized protein YycO
MSYKVYSPGQAPTKFVPGDFILVSTKGILAKCIRAGQVLRYHGKMRAYSHWNHAAMIIDSNGTIVEAAGRGVRYSNINEYQESEYYLVSTKLNKQNRDQAVAASKSFVKDKYGWFTILSIILQLVTGIEFQFSFGNSVVCSGVVAQSLWAGGVIFDSNPYQMMPADLASAYDVDSTSSKTII